MTRVKTLKHLIRWGIRLVPNRVGAYRFFTSLSPAVVRLPPECKVDSLQLGDIQAYWLAHQKACDSRVIIYLHGGGYVVGSPRTHLALAGSLAKAARAQVLMPDYRLAPEWPYPAALDDAELTYRYLLEHRVPPDRIILAGDSAGGGLAMALALRIRDDGLPAPAAVLGLSPWLDLTCSLSSSWNQAHRDPLISAERIHLFAKQYSGSADAASPSISPLHGTLDRLPPMLVQVGSDEILLPECREFASKVHKAGGQIDLEVWPDMFHVWHFAESVLPEARLAIRRVGRFVQAQVPVTVSSEAFYARPENWTWRTAHERTG